MRIAVDAMGGDYAPGVVIEGLTQALYDFPEHEFVLVGHREKLRFYLMKYGIAGHPKLTIEHAETVIEMSDPSTSVIRAKKDSSMTICARLMKEGRVDGVSTAGHTGAAVAGTKVLNRTLPGIDRAALAVSMPAREGRYILIDAGANTDCRSLNLIQFALMGDVYAEFLLGNKSPRIGLMSVGGEDVKGNDMTKAAFKLLESLPINFIGNVEGDTVFEGVADVVVCDGFTGNVLLKGAEGMAKATMYWMKKFFTKNAIRMTGAMLAKNAFRELKLLGDADELGGAPLLGVNGTCIIGHGSSSPKAVRNAIRVALECGAFKLNDRMVARIRDCHATTEELEQYIAAQALAKPKKV
jgi:glycerol-3-phosphate acyltransferase PlsX